MTILSILIGYLIGSIPVAWLIAKWRTGQDIRELGSGNVGVMNTALSVARWAGLLVFLGEIGKGILAVAISRAWGAGEMVTGLTVVATVLGTCKSIWLKGAGGRGNTTGLSALVLISWPAMLSLVGVWILVRLLARSSFYATRASWVLLAPILGGFTGSWWYALAGALLSLIYLRGQSPTTDDHLLIKARWPSLWAFLTSEPRKH